MSGYAIEGMCSIEVTCYVLCVRGCMTFRICNRRHLTFSCTGTCTGSGAGSGEGLGLWGHAAELSQARLDAGSYALIRHESLHRDVA